MRRTAVAVVLAVVLALTGCSEIPTTGSVHDGSTEGPNDTSIVYLPAPPQAGANPREIVSGFLTAASGGGDFAVAKQYLTTGFAAKWKPTRRVLVQTAQTVISVRGTSNVSVAVPVSAQVDDQGIFTPASGSQTLPFHLVQQNGQWRIDSADDGIVLGQSVFQKNYVPVALDYFDPTWSHLVPDLRWFASVRSNDSSGPSARSIVAALIRGPAGPIADPVTVNALSGAKIAAVNPSGNDVTVVALTTSGPDPSTEATARMQLQLVQSLGLPTQSALRLIVNGKFAPQAKALAGQPASEAYVVAGGKFGTMSQAGVFTEDRTLGKRVAATDPEAVTVSKRQGMAVVQQASGAVAIVTATATHVVDDRRGLVAPTLDQRGWAYSVPADGAAGSLRASNGKSQPVDLTGDLGTGEVTAIQASPDGTRMLVLTTSAAGPKAFVAGIRRTSDGTPTGLTADRYPVTLQTTSGTGIDATWVDGGDIAVLVRASDNTTDRVWSQQLGGLGGSLGEITNAVSIVGTSSTADLRIRVQAGNLYVWTNPSWQQEGDAAATASVLAVQR